MSLPILNAGGSKGLSIRAIVPPYADGDTEYTHADFAGGYRRGYKKLADQATGADKVGNIILYDKDVYPNTFSQSSKQPQSLGAKGERARVGQKIKKNVPLNYGLTGSINFSVPDAGAAEIVPVVWLSVTIAGLGPKLISVAALSGEEKVNTKSALWHVPTASLSGSVLLSKDIQLDNENGTNIKAELGFAAASQGDFTEAQLSSVMDMVKTLVSTGAAPAVGQLADFDAIALDFYFNDTELQIYQDLGIEDR